MLILPNKSDTERLRMIYRPRRFNAPRLCVARVSYARAKTFDMLVCVPKRLAETVSISRAHREKWSGCIIFKLLSRRQSNFC